MDCCAGIGLRRGCGYRLHEEAGLKRGPYDYEGNFS